ncbi:arylacetamide deacetylase [Acrasis kona]|uniref:Arylacetamide deacetylase n=1 Tax=Acrasis kona TaxID=1008807 RepID=A0AAW2YHJ3_9EUKA
MKTVLVSFLLASCLAWYLFVYDAHIDWRIKLMDMSGRVFFYKCGANAKMVHFSRECLRPMETQAPVKNHNGVISSDLEIPSITHPNTTIPARLFKPLTQSTKKRALLVHYHGGGYSLGSGKSVFHDAVLRWIVDATDSYVLSVDYRLAPEHGFPACIQDSYNTFAYLNDLYNNKDSLFDNVDVEKIVTIGDSAGATLAFSSSYILRDQSYPVLSSENTIQYTPFPKPITIKIAHQVLVYPNAHENTPSKSMKNVYLLNADMREFFTKAYLGAVQQDEEFFKSQYIFPLRSHTFKDLPTTTVVTATFDPLRDDGHLIVKKYREAGVKVNHKEYRTVHGFFFFPFLKEAIDGVEYISQVLREDKIIE